MKDAEKFVKLLLQLRGETISRVYRAIEGDWRLVTLDMDGNERGYFLRVDEDGNAVAVPRWR